MRETCVGTHNCWEGWAHLQHALHTPTCKRDITLAACIEAGHDSTCILLPAAARHLNVFAGDGVQNNGVQPQLLG